MGFEKLEKIVEIQVEYKTLGALAIHGSKDSPFESTDSPVVKIGEKPVIPGSSLKGALRSTLESMLSADGVKVCVPTAAIPKAPKGEDREVFAKKYVNGIGRKSPCQVNDICFICEIFGTTGDKEGLSGRAIFLDARSDEEIKPIERNHVAIMRDTKSQAAGKLMTLQAVDAGVVFKGNIRVINPKDSHVGALIQALNTINMVGIGAKKTSGYGELEIRLAAITLKTLKKGTWIQSQKEEKSYIDVFSAIFTEVKGK